MRLTKTITLNSDQYHLVLDILDCKMIALKEINQCHKYDKEIEKTQEIIDLIDSTKEVLKCKS